MNKNIVVIFVLVFLILIVSISIFAILGNKNYDSQNSNKIDINKEEDLEMNTVEDFEKLEIKVLTEGTGQEAIEGNTVSVNYEGTLSDGTKFDSSYDRGTPFEFELGSGYVIKGWDQGVKGMKVGEIRELKIPSSLGYGNTGAGALIPPNAGLIFKIELLEVK